MNIIIAGAGKVGFNLAKTLCIGHNVTIIDKNSQALDSIQESLDILPLRGDVEDPKSYKSFIGQEIDLFVAVTNNDNANLIAIMMSDAVLNIKKKFARIQNHFFEEKIMQDKFNIDKIIFPIKLTSKTISSLLKYPKANNVKHFKYTPLKLISIVVLSELVSKVQEYKTFKVVGIEREKKFFAPQKDTQLLVNDLVYLFGDENEIKLVCQQLENDNNFKINKCVVFGGGELGIAISKELVDINCDVKLVEKDMPLCEIAEEALKGKASIINYKYGNHDVFKDEGLEGADIFIAATNNDEYNIIKCLEAKESGIKKVVAINNEVEYYNLMHSLGIVVVRGPKINTYNTIMEEISSTRVVIQKSFCGTKAITFMRRISSHSKLIGKKIKPPKLKDVSLFYIRENFIYPIIEKIYLLDGDVIVSFCAIEKMAKVKQWIYEL